MPAPAPKRASFCGDGTCDSDEDYLGCASDCSIPTTGTATGFLNFVSGNFNTLLWVLMMLVGVLLVLAYISYKSRKNEDEFGLSDYLEGRNKE